MYHVYYTGEFQKSAIKANKDVLLEYKGLKQNYLLSTIKRDVILCNAVTFLVLNVRSLPRHVTIL